MADFVTELRERRVLPVVGVYVASSWVLVEILDRLVERYLLSPYLTDIVFWGLFSLIPAVLLVAWTHGKPGKDKSTRAGKVGVPINLIATLGLLITVFGDKDLGLAATQVTVSNEMGQQETHYIPSETFRRRMAVFFWKNESGLPELDWLQYGITELLVQDLQQDTFILANSPWNNPGYYSRMRQAGFDDGLGVPRSLMRRIANESNRQYFIEGSLNNTADEYIVSARIWDSQTLELIDEVTVQNWDIYSAVDDLSIEIREALDVPKVGRHIAEDLPLAETYGESEEALKAYINGMNARLFDNDFESSNAFFAESTRIDPNFVLGWFLTALNMVESGNLPAAQAAMAKAQELDYRLPANDRAQLKAMTYRFAGEHEKQMAFLRLQTRIRDDATSHNYLARMLMISGQLDEAKVESLTALERDALNVGILLRMSILERATGNMDSAVEYAREYQQHKPEDMEANIILGDILRDSGELDAAQVQYMHAQILENAPVEPTLRLAEIAARKGDINTARDYLVQAEGFTRTPAQKVQVRQSASALEARLGRLNEAIRQTTEQEVFLRQSQPPLAVALGIYAQLAGYYVELGNISSARESLQIALGMVEAPMDKFLAFSDAMILASEDEFSAAEAAVDRGAEVIELFQLKLLEFQIPITRAWIARESGDYLMMADHYQAALEMIEHSVIASQVQFAVPGIYAGLAFAQVHNGQLDAAGLSLAAGFQLDPNEPLLWLSKARLQQAKNMPQLALASVNYALAIWKDADDDYLMANRAKSLAAELVGSNSN